MELQWWTQVFNIGWRKQCISNIGWGKCIMILFFPKFFYIVLLMKKRIKKFIGWGTQLPGWVRPCGTLALPFIP